MALRWFDSIGGNIDHNLSIFVYGCLQSARIASSTTPTTAGVAPGSSSWMGDNGSQQITQITQIIKTVKSAKSVDKEGGK